MQSVEGWVATKRSSYDSICYSLWYHMVLFYDATSSPLPWPMPLLVLPSIVICHPPPVIRCQSSAACYCLRNSPPNLVNCCPCHRLRSLHCLPRQRYGIAPTVVAVMPRCRSREMLMSMSTLALTAFASWLQPLAKRRCRVGSHVAPNAFCCRCCCRRCHLCIVVVIAATPTIVEPMPPGEPSRRHLMVRQQAYLHPISFLLIVA